MRNSNWYGLFLLFATLAVFAFWGTVFYVAWHFVTKYW